MRSSPERESGSLGNRVLEVCHLGGKRLRRLLPGLPQNGESPDFLRALNQRDWLATLIHQRRLTPSCGGQAPTAERTVDPARNVVESLTSRSGIREQNRHECDIARSRIDFRFWGKNGRAGDITGTTEFDPKHTSHARRLMGRTQVLPVTYG